MEDRNAAKFFLLSPFFLRLLCVLISISIPHYRVTVRSFFKFHFPFYIAMIFVVLFDTYIQTDITALYCRMQQYPRGLLVSVRGITAGDSDVLSVLNMHSMVTLSGAWGTPCRTYFFVVTNAHI